MAEVAGVRAILNTGRLLPRVFPFPLSILLAPGRAEYRIVFKSVANTFQTKR
jgi:hypothetical protein